MTLRNTYPDWQDGNWGYWETANHEQVNNLIKGRNVNEKDAYGCTPLELAIRRTFQPLVIRLLLNAGANLHTVYKGNRTPFHLVAEFNNECGIIEELLNFNANLDSKVNVNATDDNKNTPLHVAASCNVNRIAIITALINNGANPNMQNNDGRTPLHLLAMKNKEWDRYGIYKSVKILVRIDGVNCILEDSDKKTALYYAETNPAIKGTDAYEVLRKASE